MKTHGMSKTKFYDIWCSIKDRCNCKNSGAYKYYGKYGVIYSKRWEKFENFYIKTNNKLENKKRLEYRRYYKKESQTKKWVNIHKKRYLLF